MKVISKDLIMSLTKLAQTTIRRRKNMNFHRGDADPIQRMLNAFEPKTYVRPHKHQNPDKREVFIILTGRLLVLFFNEKGEIINHVILDRNTGVFAVEIASGEWHTATGLEEGTVVYEIKDGPYNMLDDKNFATWAPAETDVNAQNEVERWLAEIEISI